MARIRRAVANTETIIGGTGADTIILVNAVANANIDLHAGNDTLSFGDFTNSASVANVETITGGTGNDAITLASALTTTTSIDLGSGSNKLTLAASGGTGSVSNVRTLMAALAATP